MSIRKKFIKAKQLIRERKYKILFLKTIEFFRWNSIFIVYTLWTKTRLLRKMQNDERFKIVDTWGGRNANELMKSIIHSPVLKYEIDEVMIKDLKAWIGNGKMGNIKDTFQYGYASKTYEKNYYTFLEGVFKNYNLSGNTLENKIRKTIERCSNTIKSIKDNGYDIHKGAIIVDDKNNVLDGVHRCSILCSLFGEEYKIKVLRIFYNRRREFEIDNVTASKL